MTPLEEKLWKTGCTLGVVWLLHVYFDRPGYQCFATFVPALCVLFAAFVMLVHRKDGV